MAHEIEHDDHMLAVGKTPWHKLGTVLPAGTVLTSEQAIIAAHLGWRVNLQPVVTMIGGAPIDVPSVRAVVRDDTGAVLGSVGDGFRTLQNDRAFAAFDPLVESGVLRYETAGSLRHGARVWILARLMIKDLDVGGDRIAPYVLLAHGHTSEASLAVMIKPSFTRVVCANTLACSLGESVERVRIAHRGNVGAKVDEAVAGLDAIRVAAEIQADQYRELARRPADVNDVARYLAAVWRRPLAEIVGGKQADGTSAAPMRRALDIVDVFATGGRGRTRAADGTWWGVYQALTQVLTHGQPGSKRSSSQRMDSVAFGSNGDTSTRGLALASVLSERKGVTWEDLIGEPTSAIKARANALQIAA